MALIDSCEMCAADISVKSNYRCLCMKYVWECCLLMLFWSGKMHIYQKRKSEGV